jgi:hypothetical protein
MVHRLISDCTKILFTMFTTKIFLISQKNPPTSETVQYQPREIQDVGRSYHQVQSFSFEDKREFQKEFLERQVFDKIFLDFCPHSALYCLCLSLPLSSI